MSHTMLKKNGTPTSEVTIPTGTMTPGILFFAAQRPAITPARLSARCPEGRNGDLPPKVLAMCGATSNLLKPTGLTKVTASVDNKLIQQCTAGKHMNPKACRPSSRRNAVSCRAATRKSTAQTPSRHAQFFPTTHGPAPSSRIPAPAAYLHRYQTA